MALVATIAFLELQRWRKSCAEANRDDTDTENNASTTSFTSVTTSEAPAPTNKRATSQRDDTQRGATSTAAASVHVKSESDGVNNDSTAAQLTTDTDTDVSAATTTVTATSPPIDTDTPEATTATTPAAAQQEAAEQDTVMYPDCVITMTATARTALRGVLQTASGAVVGTEVGGGLCLTSTVAAMLPPNQMNLSPSASRLLAMENENAKSKASEVVSMEFMQRTFGATLMKTEKEIEYFAGKKTDYICIIAPCVVAVSVTRAAPYNGEFDIEAAARLLRKKLRGVTVSNGFVRAEDRWDAQILHLMCSSQEVADVVMLVYNAMLTPDEQGTAIVVTTVCEDAPWIFY